MKISELLFEEKITIDNVVYDNTEGLGATGYNANVTYRGMEVLMTPSMFLHLALHLSRSMMWSTDHIKEIIQKGEPIASPYLEIDLKDDENEKPTGIDAKIIGHEGRNRAMALKELNGNKPILVHIFFRGLRARHITPQIIEAINKKLIDQNGFESYGPFFTVHSLSS